MCKRCLVCVLKHQAPINLLHLLDTTCLFFLLLVERYIDGGRIGGSEHVHQQEGCWLGFRRNLQALGVAQGEPREGAAAQGWTPWLAAQQFACTPHVMLQSQGKDSAPLYAF